MLADSPLLRLALKPAALKIIPMVSPCAHIRAWTTFWAVVWYLEAGLAGTQVKMTDFLLVATDNSTGANKT
jgi:hypothetical protein